MSLRRASRHNVTPAHGRSPRRGFSMLELLIVMIILGISAAMVMPKLGPVRDRGAVRSSKQELAADLVLARSAAIRRGRPAQVRIAANSLWVTVTQPNGTTARLGGTERLDGSLGVTLTPTSDSVVYDQRGMASGASTSTKVFRFTRNRIVDSLCVNRLGLIARRCGA